jgi:hypothetical protein
MPPKLNRINSAKHRRALERLAGSRDGCTVAITIAHDFTVEQMVELVQAGLATATAERVVAGGRMVIDSSCRKPPK